MNARGNMMNSLKSIAGVLFLLAAVPICRADSIRLKPTASAQRNQEVRLGDIAVVSGDDAQTLANTVIVAGIEKTSKIDANDVLMAVISQRGTGVGGETLHVSGAGECLIIVEEKAPSKIVVAAPKTLVETKMVSTVEQPPAAPDSSPAVGASAANKSGTLAAEIRARVLKELNLPADDVSVRFDTISPLLEYTVPAGRQWLSRPLTRTFLGTVQFEAQLVEGTKVLEKLNVQTTVQRMQWVPVSTTRISRGKIMTADDLRMEKLPMDRKLPQLFSTTKDVIGLEAQRDMDVGTMMDQRDFRPAYLTRKNEPITVYVVSGSLTVQVRGRSVGDAKMHEPVQVKNETSRDVYSAVVIGKGLAVAGGTLTAEEEQRIREGMQP
jgi:flagella basal body P-ring formation protein FlgA